MAASGNPSIARQAFSAGSSLSSIPVSASTFSSISHSSTDSISSKTISSSSRHISSTGSSGPATSAPRPPATLGPASPTLIENGVGPHPPSTSRYQATFVQSSGSHVYTTVVETASLILGEEPSLSGNGQNNNNSTSRTGAIVGGLVGGVASLVFIALLAIVLLRRARQKQLEEKFDGNFDPGRMTRSSRSPAPTNGTHDLTAESDDTGIGRLLVTPFVLPPDMSEKFQPQQHIPQYIHHHSSNAPFPSMPFAGAPPIYVASPSHSLAHPHFVPRSPMNHFATPDYFDVGADGSRRGGRPMSMVSTASSSASHFGVAAYSGAMVPDPSSAAFSGPFSFNQGATTAGSAQGVSPGVNHGTAGAGNGLVPFPVLANGPAQPHGISFPPHHQVVHSASFMPPHSASFMPPNSSVRPEGVGGRSLSQISGISTRSSTPSRSRSRAPSLTSDEAHSVRVAQEMDTVMEAPGEETTQDDRDLRQHRERHRIHSGTVSPEDLENYLRSGPVRPQRLSTSAPPS